MAAKEIILSTAPEAVMTKNYSPPLGLLYVAAALEKNGFEVSIIDAYIERLSIDDIAEKVSKTAPVAFGITGTTENRFNAIQLLNKVKKVNSGILTFWGGPHASLTYNDVMDLVSSVDVIIKGEGEFTVVEMLEAYLNKKEFYRIPGLVFRDTKGKIVNTLLRAPIQDLDSLSIPARHLLDMKKYSTLVEGEYRTPAVGVISSRGCPFECTFCANVALGKRALRKRSPVGFVDEIEFLYRSYGYRGFDIWDDTITVDTAHITGICNEIINRKLDIIWYARARVDCVNKEILQLMKKAGCVSIGYGIESGSERILKSIKKGITLKKARSGVKLSAELGFIVRCFFILSLPSETIGDIGFTVNLIKEFNSYPGDVKCYYGFAKIYPGTELEQEAIRLRKFPLGFQWNKYFEFLKSKLFEENPTIPLFENEGLKIEDIKAFVSKSLYTRREIFIKAIRKILTLKSFRDVFDTFKLLRSENG